MSNYFDSTNEELDGIWRIVPSPTFTEIIAQSGFDFQILDCEHGGYDFQTLEADIRACGIYDCQPFVRVSGLNKVEVQRCLDLGAAGIVFPQLNNYDDFSQAVKMLQYAPAGIRGYNPFVRAAGYGIENTNSKTNPLCIPIIETLSAVNDLDRILTLEGIDAFYIGTYDLTAQLGCLGQTDAPQLVETVDLIVEKCRVALKPIVVMVGNRRQYENYKAKRLNIFVHSVDSYQIKKAFTDSIKQFKSN